MQGCWEGGGAAGGGGPGRPACRPPHAARPGPRPTTNPPSAASIYLAVVCQGGRHVFVGDGREGHGFVAVHQVPHLGVLGVAAVVVGDLAPPDAGEAVVQGIWWKGVGGAVGVGAVGVGRWGWGVWGWGGGGWVVKMGGWGRGGRGWRRPARRAGAPPPPRRAGPAFPPTTPPPTSHGGSPGAKTPWQWTSWA